MSQINVNRIKDSNEGAPDFPSGVNVSGITSTVTLGVTNLNPTNVNVSGVVTATTLDGNLLATGTPTLGLGVTINASGLNISGVATAGIVSATTLFGNGANITGIALTIAPLNYNPAVLGSEVAKTTGIGLTFNQGVKAGSGNVTLRIAGAAGTVVENFGVGNSVSYSNGDTVTITPTSSLNASETYHLSYPSGAFTNIGGDVSYVGTAYTFGVKDTLYQLWAWGYNAGDGGTLAQNNIINYSSPVQIPGTNWGVDVSIFAGATNHNLLMLKNDNTLWTWGTNGNGALGQNGGPQRSSPVQIPGTTWAKSTTSYYGGFAIKTDGTLWSWGANEKGQLGQNIDDVNQSSPIQIPGTTWSSVSVGQNNVYAIKTNGTLWTWGESTQGALGQNTGPGAHRSSPVQVPGTNWRQVTGGVHRALGTKTDGTLWTWGNNDYGQLGQNNEVKYSSPVQIPGTTWSKGVANSYFPFAIKTDGTLWGWGSNEIGALGINVAHDSHRSSPTQVSGTTWSDIMVGSGANAVATKTDGTLWVWGENGYGQLGQNQPGNADYSSPVQIPGTGWAQPLSQYIYSFAIKEV